MLLQIPLTLSKRLSYFGMYTAKTRLLTKFKSAFLNLLIVTKKTGKSIAELINETLRKEWYTCTSGRLSLVSYPDPNVRSITSRTEGLANKSIEVVLHGAPECWRSNQNREFA